MDKIYVGTEKFYMKIGVYHHGSKVYKNCTFLYLTNEKKKNTVSLKNQDHLEEFGKNGVIKK